MFSGTGLANSTCAGIGPGNQATEVVAVWAIGAENLLVEKPFDSATQADLVGITLGAHGPAHLTVPAAPEQHHAGTGGPRDQKT